MPHRHAPPPAAPGVYCSGTLPDGRPCRLMLAAELAGLHLVRRDRIEVVCFIVSVKCHRCRTNNVVDPSVLQMAARRMLSEVAAG